jgi:hypothetical protein
LISYAKEYMMIDDNDHGEGYEGIDQSLWEEVDRRIERALSKQKHEQNRLLKTTEDNALREAKIRKLRDETKKRIDRILQWAREQN